MKVLFVVSGNSTEFEIVPFIKSQGQALQKLGLVVEYFRVEGKGLKGYLKNLIPLRRRLRAGGFDLIHAHYSLNGLLALLTMVRKPIVVSYMGSDSYGTVLPNGRTKLSSVWIVLLSILIQPFVSYVICKSENIRKRVYKKHCSVVPNGVDLDVFKPCQENSEKEKIGTRKILFPGNTRSKRKNYQLLLSAIESLKGHEIEIVAPFPVDQEALNELYNQADMMALCSLEEGSPNVVKEAMACNCPIVSTDVGDVRWLFGSTDGHLIASNDPKDYADKISTLLNRNGRTEGRSRLLTLGLDGLSVGSKIFDIYMKVLKISKEQEKL